ncbi:hypothetical protein K4L44_03100 [Halosquirtibacter laminarini]|uniref:Uncharacterized protein n=1 Tax=Halosquirtibacter laminarini TaxID=3374600 RepID=A0AC61NPY5_9BACT|nr:hypothetical protein K4L44_03100 [Prolixibacteraceae bacterium]
MNKTRIGVIGMGYRGKIHFQNILQRKNVVVVAISDPSMNREEIISWCEDAGHPIPAFYTEREGYEEMLQNELLDGIILSVPWDHFTAILCRTLSFNLMIGVEASSISKLSEIDQIMNSYFANSSKVMILENACYHRDVMSIFNMVQKGLFGELLHMRGGYEHDLRGVKFDKNYQYGTGAEGEASWRTIHSLKRNGDLYPSHGIGPLSYLLDINRGNRFISISSFATKSKGLSHHLKKHLGTDHPNANISWKLGDVITSNITTARGETIILTHATNTCRPYSLDFRVQGTEGIWIQENGNHLHIDSLCEHGEWSPSPLSILREYDAPCWKENESLAATSVRHEMDYFVLDDFIKSTQDEKEPKFDIYDMATWLSISALSEISIEKGGVPIPFPDFTLGKWKSRESFYSQE